MNSYHILNPIIDIDYYSYELKKNNIVTIPNIFNELYAEKIYQDIQNIPFNWWKNAIYFDKELHDNIPFDISDKIKNNQYCFSFKKCCDHYDTCVCVVCTLEKELKSDYFSKFFKEITGKNSKVIDFTATIYEKGDFLTTHNDIEKGDYAFIFSFNKNWNPNYGGLLNFIQDNKIHNVFIPSFNTLTIFRLPLDKPNYHFVSQVVVDKKRYSFTGWVENFLN